MNANTLFSTPFLKTRMSEDFRLLMLNFLFANFDFNNILAEYDDNNLFESHPNSKELYEFKRLAFSLVKDFVGESAASLITHQRAWICGTGSNYFMKSHNHASSVVSTVFYFQANEGGEVIFHDPRTNANRGYSSEFYESLNFKDYRFTPSSGDIIVFPSFLYHSVPPYKGQSTRVAVALDLFADT